MSGGIALGRNSKRGESMSREAGRDAQGGSLSDEIFRDAKDERYRSCQVGEDVVVVGTDRGRKPCSCVCHQASFKKPQTAPLVMVMEVSAYCFQPA